jgi:hypothetical protein
MMIPAVEPFAPADSPRDRNVFRPETRNRLWEERSSMISVRNMFRNPTVVQSGAAIFWSQVRPPTSCGIKTSLPFLLPS